MPLIGRAGFYAGAEEQASDMLVKKKGRVKTPSPLEDEHACLTHESVVKSVFKVRFTYAATRDRRSLISMSTLSLALSRPRAFRFLSIWAIINRAIS